VCLSVAEADVNPLKCEATLQHIPYSTVSNRAVEIKMYMSWKHCAARSNMPITEFNLNSMKIIVDAPPKQYLNQNGSITEELSEHEITVFCLIEMLVNRLLPTAIQQLRSQIGIRVIHV